MTSPMPTPSFRTVHGSLVARHALELIVGGRELPASGSPELVRLLTAIRAMLQGTADAELVAHERDALALSLLLGLHARAEVDAYAAQALLAAKEGKPQS